MERKEPSDSGGNSRPQSICRQAPPTVPGSPRLPSSTPLPLASLPSGQHVKPDLSLDPSLLLGVLLEVGRGQPSPAPEGGSPMGTRHFLILGSPDRAHRAILLQPHPMSFLTLPLPGSLPLLPPFFSSPEATVTVTWSTLCPS